MMQTVLNGINKLFRVNDNRIVCYANDIIGKSVSNLDNFSFRKRVFLAISLYDQ